MSFEPGEFDDDDLDSSDTQMFTNSNYITEDELSKFYNPVNHFSAINLLHVNCRSLKKNFNHLKNLISMISEPVMAIAVTETWLVDSLHHAYELPNYNFVGKSRTSRGGGGVGLYLNNCINYKLRPELCRMCEYLECVFVEIDQSDKQNIIVGSIYRPPNTDSVLFNGEITSILQCIDGESKLICVAGDFNLDLIKYGNHTATSDFLSIMLSHSLFPTVNKPTRVTGQTATLIDNIFVNCFKNSVKSAIIYSDISDHFPIAIQIEKSVRKVNLNVNYKKRIFDSFSIKQFRDELQTMPWDEVYNCVNNADDTSGAYECFHGIFHSIFIKHFPEITRRGNNKMTPRHEWMTKGLMRSCLRKSKLYKSYRKKGTADSKRKYIAYRNRLKIILHKAENKFYFEKCKQMHGNIKQTWKLLNNILNKNKIIVPMDSFIINGIKTSNAHEIVSKFNEYFTNIGTSLAARIPTSSRSFSSYMNQTHIDSFALQLSNPSEVVRIISELKIKSSSGYDSIPLSIVRDSAEFIAEPICEIINSSFRTGIFPDDLKIGKVCPVFKSGEKDIFSNYRPISILPSMSKIFEKAMFVRLSDYLEKKQSLIMNQYGFRKKHSTYMAIMDMYDRISKAIDKNEYCIGIFIDLSKAFDTLDHDILLSKLEHYGVRGIALDWFRNYLRNRKQYVYYNGISSDFMDISCGVPQGSILGPLLFILYINDIVNCSDVLQFILFADDTNLFLSNTDIWQLMDLINDELSKLDDWFRANKLSLNISKTNYMMFGRKQYGLSDQHNLFQLKINGIEINRVESTTFLGVIFDEKLTWAKHIDHVSLNVSKALGVINRIKAVMPPNILLMLYHTMITPHLMYCNIMWGCAKPTVLQKLFILQKRALRVITRSSYLTPSNSLFVRLRLLKLSDIYKSQISLFAFKFLQKLLPASCTNYLKINSVLPYSMRKTDFFHVPACRTIIRENCISVSGPKHFNSLPAKLQNCCSISSFKIDLLKYQLSLY